MRVLVRHKTDNNGRVIPAGHIIQEVAEQYVGNKLKTSSGDVWEVVPFRNMKGQNFKEGVEVPEFMTVR